METSLLALLVCLLLFAGVLYYIFIIKQANDLGAGGKSGLFSILFVLAPLILIALWSQSGSEERLSQIGFKPHPSFISSVGAATGSGDNPLWMFSTNADPNSIFQFYKLPENHGDWSMVSESADNLIFTKGEKRFSIFVAKDSVVFTMLQAK